MHISAVPEYLPS